MAELKLGARAGQKGAARSILGTLTGPPAGLGTIVAMRWKRAVFGFLVAWMAAAQSGPAVGVTGGRIRGRLAPDGGAAFKGIPYARPPLGDLRWREPQPVAPWKGIREATAFSLPCTQLSEGWNKRLVEGSAEDCLYLNVAAPEWPPKSKHPVFVWIHGGSNTAGSGEAAGFDQRTLVRRGVVLVTINYRLGALGFLVHPELARESRHHVSGNYGLMDQVAALQWVRRNIRKFGGDPRNVTAAGESAGAFDISLLMTSPLAKGLFHRAIAESGAASGFNWSMTAVHAEANGRKMAAHLKAPEGGAIPYLRTVGPREILQAAKDSTNADRTGLQTSVDGYVLPEPPAVVFAEGHGAPVPMITGSNAQETGGSMPSGRLREAIQKAYGDLADRALKLYGLTDPLYGVPGRQWTTDIEFRCPSTAQAVAHAAAGNATYEYEFERPLPGEKATFHSSELNFVFGTWGENVKLAAEDQKLSEQVQAYWANFARTGDPNGEGLPAWPKFTVNAQDYLAFTDHGAVAKSGMRRECCEVYIEDLKARTAR
ncbi:MAG: carboxylesterase family protein [Bryobacteraceae bacterium]|jgi:para-nitrobenzyl esterase